MVKFNEQSILLSPYHNCDSPNCIAGFPICACAAGRLLKPKTLAPNGSSYQSKTTPLSPCA